MSTTESYTWSITESSKIKKIKSAKCGKNWISPTFTMFDMDYFLELFPNGSNAKKQGSVNLYFNLQSLPSNVESLQILYKLSFIEGDISWSISRSETLSSKQLYYGWSPRCLLTKNLKKYDTLTFKLEMELLGVYDHDDNDIVDQYISQKEEEEEEEEEEQEEIVSVEHKLELIAKQMQQLKTEVAQLTQQVIDIRMQIQEEEKMDDQNHNHDQQEQIAKIMKELKEIKESMNKPIISKDEAISEAQRRLKVWLQHEVGLKEYYDIFIEHGVDDLNVVELITKHELKEMNIHKVGHQMKILSGIEKLKQRKYAAADNHNEGMDVAVGPTMFI